MSACLRFLCCLLLALAPFGGAWADTTVALFKSFAGNVNFTGTQRTLRTGANGSSKTACGVTSANSNVSATLAGLPSGATVLSAQLYWAVSGTGTVKKSGNIAKVYMDDVLVTATPSRTYSAQVSSGSLTYSGAAADVTAAVAAKGNGTYRFRGLVPNTDNSFCNVEGVLGGFQLLVVYSDPGQPFRVLNLYEGFQDMQYNGITLNLSNFKIPATLAAGVTGRLGHVTWEGDSTLVANGEDLLFNSTEMVDGYNPAHNQFNSSSNINGDTRSYGIDFDAYTVGAPTIQPNQTTATTRYQTGQDMVILAAEVIAVPNVPVADLSMTITVADNTPSLGQANSYSLVVSNAGPSTETGPVTVTDTIPASMSITSASGSGWTCTVAGQNVSCTRAGVISPATSLPAITIGVVQNGIVGGAITNTAQVTGQNFDNNGGNNSASVDVTIAALPTYVFTDKACVHNVAFGTAGQCAIKTFPAMYAGAVLGNIYITALTNGVPTRFSNSGVTAKSMVFGLRCVNPATTANVASYMTPTIGTTVGTAVPIPPCLSASGTFGVTTTSSTVNLSFPSGSPTASAFFAFQYKDVGQVDLVLLDTGRTPLARSGIFTVQPKKVGFVSITRTVDGAANPALYPLAKPVAPDTFLTTVPAFLHAGDAFQIAVAAYALDGITVTPNFGREAAPATQQFFLSKAAAINPLRGTPANPLPFAEMVDVPDVQGGFAPVVKGVASGNTFRWDGVGILELSVRTQDEAPYDYLGSGLAVDSDVRNVGRFVPYRFNTSVVPPFSCSASMTCEDVSGVAYSNQPFGIGVTATLSNGVAPARNYNGAFASNVSLSAWSAAGGTTQVAGTFTTGAPSTASAPMVAGALFPGLPLVPSGVAPASLAFLLPLPSTGPTDIFVRAVANDAGLGGAIFPITSATGGTEAIEGGLRIVNGQLKVGSNMGPKDAPLQAHLTARYWGGADKGWMVSDFDSATSVPMGQGAYTICIGVTCPLLPLTAPSVVLAAGKGTFTVPAPGVRGRAQLQFDAVKYLAPVPGTLTFGIRKSPVIYIREAY